MAFYRFNGLNRHKPFFSQLSYIAELSIFIVLERKWPFIDLMRFFNKHVFSLLLSIAEVHIEKTMS